MCWTMCTTTSMKKTGQPLPRQRKPSSSCPWKSACIAIWRYRSRRYLNRIARSDSMTFCQQSQPWYGICGCESACRRWWPAPADRRWSLGCLVLSGVWDVLYCLQVIGMKKARQGITDKSGAWPGFWVIVCIMRLQWHIVKFCKIVNSPFCVINLLYWQYVP